MDVKKKILTLCSAGNNRSVCAGYLLKHQYRHDSIAAGVHANSPATVAMLCEWADIILICGEAALTHHVPVHLLLKVVDLGIGPDIWSPSYHPDLLAKMKEALRKLGLVE